MLLLFLRTGVYSTLWVLSIRNAAGEGTVKEVKILTPLLKFLEEL